MKRWEELEDEEEDVSSYWMALSLNIFSFPCDFIKRKVVG
jgi:hypothetical protein